MSVSEIIAAYQAGGSLRQVAAQAGLHHERVRQALIRARVPLRPVGSGTDAVQWTPEMDAALSDLRRAGKGAIPCGRRIGVCGRLVRQRVRELNMPANPRAKGRGR